MWGPNSYAWVLMQLATAQAGIILVRRFAWCGWVSVRGVPLKRSPLVSWPQNQTSTWLVSDQVGSFS